MNRQEAIRLLKQKSDEAVRIASLPYLNGEYLPWRRNVEDILEAAFGVSSTEYKRVAGIKPETIRGTASKLQRAYVMRVATIQSEVESIIQKYEQLGIGSGVSPEAVVRQIPASVFISHGKGSVALRKLEQFMRALGIEPLIVVTQASLDKDVPDKVSLYLGQADFVVILATRDDTVRDRKTGAEIRQPRQNVVHEIGLAQKTHPGRVIYLLEKGASFPSNISPRVWASFTQRSMMDAFLAIIRELRSYGLLRVMKSPVE